MKSSKLFKKIPPRLSFFLLVAVILLMPFTISTLLTRADDQEGELESNEEYQQLEEELDFLSQQEREVLESLKGVVAEEKAETASQEEDSLIDPNGEVDNSEAEAELTTVREEAIGVINSGDETPVPEEEAIDPVIAPSQVDLKIKIKGGDDVKPGRLWVVFVGVGRDPVKVRPNEKGEVRAVLDSGRYYVEVESDYYQAQEEEDLPAFFLSANKEVDLGTSEIIKK